MKRPFRDCRNCKNNNMNCCPDWNKPERRTAPFCDWVKVKEQDSSIPRLTKDGAMTILTTGLEVTDGFKRS